MSKPVPSDSNHKKNALEWTVFGLSCALLGGVIATLIHEELTIGEEPAHFIVEMGTPLISSDQVRIPVTVTNRGDEPSLAVEIQVTGDLSGTENSATVQFDYIPHRAHRKGWVSFPGNSVPSGLSSRVLGYRDP